MKAGTVTAEISTNWKIVGWFAITTFHHRDVANSLLGFLGMFKAFEASFVATTKTVFSLSLSVLFLKSYRFF